jgi:hypothetical protein
VQFLPLRIHGGSLNLQTVLSHEPCHTGSHQPRPETRPWALTWGFGGAACRTRTHDPLITKTLPVRSERSDQVPAHHLSHQDDATNGANKIRVLRPVPRALFRSSQAKDLRAVPGVGVQGRRDNWEIGEPFSTWAGRDDGVTAVTVGTLGDEHSGPNPVETEIPDVDGEQRADVIAQLWTAGDGGCLAHSFGGYAPTGLSVRGDGQSCHQLVAARRAISAVSSMTTALGTRLRARHGHHAA